jgi:hypothetical protein
MSEHPAQGALSPHIEALRIAHGILSPTQFITAIQHGEMEIWSLPREAYALIAWGVCAEGETCNILTVTGDMAEAGAVGLAAIESLARARGAKVIITVARHGWAPLFKAHGYEITPKILAKKVLMS